MQVKLKDFLEESLSNIRVIAASSVNLQQRMKKGEFNSHLFYQLSVTPIYLPALRERKEEIPAIADYFLKGAVREANLRAKQFSLDALEDVLSLVAAGCSSKHHNLIGGQYRIFDRAVHRFDAHSAHQLQGRGQGKGQVYIYFRDVYGKAVTDRVQRGFLSYHIKG